MVDGVARQELAVVVLAAGKGTRMASDLPKVLHPVLGRTSLAWVLEAAAALAASDTVVVVGHGAEQVGASLPPSTRTALQEQQLGTGDAVRAGLEELADFAGDVLVVNGDGALFTSETMRRVVDAHRASGAAATVLAAEGRAEWPLGRVINHPDGRVDRIIEAADATAEELAVLAMNAGVYCFDAAFLRAALPQLSTANAKGEVYLTDLFAAAEARGLASHAVIGDDPDELLGINDRRDLAEVEDILRRRILDVLLRSGVTVSMPHTVLVEPTVRVDPDAVLLPGTILRGATHVAAEAVIGPDSELVDTVVERGATVERSVSRDARIGEGVTVGPFAFLRPGADLRAKSKAGAFVEIKNSVIGERSKVPHLSYVGDAVVGTDSNIGAGNITANYRPELGSGKQQTVIGNHVRTGSDCVLVAPITIGDGAWTGAGSIVVKDVPAGALAIARAHQKNIENYADRVAGGVVR